MSAASDRTHRVVRWCVIAATVALLALTTSRIVADVRQQNTNADYGQFLMHSPCSRPAPSGVSP